MYTTSELEDFTNSINNVKNQMQGANFCREDYIKAFGLQYGINVVLKTWEWMRDVGAITKATHNVIAFGKRTFEFVSDEPVQYKDVYRGYLLGKRKADARRKRLNFFRTQNQ